jgi:DNA polymerase-3 subunit beta
MIVQINRKTLLKAMETVVSAVPHKPSHPILGMIYFESQDGVMVVRGFNLSFGIEYRFLVEEEKSFKFMLPRLAIELISQLESEVIDLEIAQEDTGFIHTLKADATETKLHALNPDNYSDFPQKKSEQAIEICTDVLASAGKKLAHAASKDETKQVLTGINIAGKTKDTPTGTYQELHFGATDGHRLACIIEEASSQEIKNFVESKTFPVTALNEIFKIAKQERKEKIWLSFEDDAMFGDIGDNCSVFSRIFTGAYPNYQSLFPTKFSNYVSVSRKDFLSKLRYVNTISPIEVVLKISSSNIDIEAVSIDLGTSKTSIECTEIKGEDIQLCFNIKYLIDAISFFDSDWVSINSNSPDSPVVFNNYLDTSSHYLLMPLNKRKQ